MTLFAKVGFNSSLAFLVSLLLVTSPLLAEEPAGDRSTSAAATSAASCRGCAGSDAAEGCRHLSKGEHSECKEKSKESCCGKTCDHQNHKGPMDEHCPMMNDMKTSKSE